MKDLFDKEIIESETVTATPVEITEVVEIKLTQEPIIKYDSLVAFASNIQNNLEKLNVEKMPATDDNKKTLKETRAEINKNIKTFEDERKRIKKLVLDPYELFEKDYKELIKDPLEKASNVLKTKIDAIEDVQKKEKEEELRAYFDEKKIAYEIDFLIFEDLDISVGVSTVVSAVKRLTDQVFTETLADLNKIKSSKHQEKLLKHYIKVKDLKKAEELTREELQQEARVNQMIQSQAVEITVNEPVSEEIEKPVMEEIKDNQIYEMSFKVWGTKEQLISIKNYIEKEGIKYE